MISKKIMNKAIELEKEFKIKDIMYYQMLLEMHNGSLENFMCNLEIDWNTNPVKVALYNGSDMPQRIYPKSRIAQLIISPYKEEILEVSSELSETDRGFGGFGSTGM